MRRDNNKSPIDIQIVPSRREVEEWTNRSDCEKRECCAADEFQLDLESTVTTDWNRSATKIFVKDFIASGEYDCTDRKAVERAFKSHFNTLRRHWNQSQLTRERIEDQKAQHSHDTRKRNVSCPLLFQRRLHVAVSTEQLRHHVSMLQYLGVDSMSSDEPDTHNGLKQYRILCKKWRHPAMGPWLQAFDAVYRQTKHIASESQRGTQPRTRFLSNREDNMRPPVKRLPRNAYNPEWYNELNVIDRDNLEAGPDYDFTHLPDIMR
ncbi:hypothetical protein WOLCODRAFT_67930 [Wolfiporia cocos MD-104 SS10]|uniref:Uncharacterized protein n=1 Tax=Wolfiporia cocos (strain MD-104) TaxID=742152 RepID=A0A2H3JDC1_WOLCO|nr:hypothetical protein WOLCODRAFT_67930 [Wolfiporia cocos MD-104 SS10]